MQNSHLNGICVLTVHCTELNINFQESDYVVAEGDPDPQDPIIFRFREVQNSFTVTLHPVSITEARNPAGPFDVDTFISYVPADAEATPGNVVVLSQKFQVNIY